MKGRHVEVGPFTPVEDPVLELAHLREACAAMVKEDEAEPHMFPRCGFRLEVGFRAERAVMTVTHSLGEEAERRLAEHIGPLVAAVFNAGMDRSMELAAKVMEAKAALEKQPTLPGLGGEA